MIVSYLFCGTFLPFQIMNLYFRIKLHKKIKLLDWFIAINCICLLCKQLYKKVK